jgi:nucleoid-associated protein YgaU
MYVRKLTLPLVVVLAVMLLGVSGLFAQEEMTMDEYSAQLAEWQKREVDAKAAIAEVGIENTALEVEIAKVQAEIDAEWAEIYAMIDADEAAVKEYMAGLKDLEKEANGLAALTPDELYQRRAEIDALEAKLAEAKTSKISALTEADLLIAGIEGKIAQLRATLDAARKWDEYVVVKGDYLWKIAGKEDIYDNPYQWIQIYTKNRDMISNPDLIYPDWNLKIQRRLENNEYLVQKGDFLKMIAENPEVYGDPSRWTEIYEANKDVIEKSNKTEGSKMLYPYQVLIVPGK